MEMKVLICYSVNKKKISGLNTPSQKLKSFQNSLSTIALTVNCVKLQNNYTLYFITNSPIKSAYFVLISNEGVVQYNYLSTPSFYIFVANYDNAQTHTKRR